MTTQTKLNTTQIPVTTTVGTPGVDTQVPTEKAVREALTAGGSVNYACQGRLTLESGIPISTTDQADKTTLYFTPYKGDLIYIYDGVSAWVPFNFTELSLNISAFTASKPYDIFIYNNSGTPTLEGLVWTNATTRATALALQNGVYVKSGATTRRYLGTIYMDAASKCQDKLSKRYVWNYYNRVARQLEFGMTATTSWTIPTNGNFRAFNNDTAHQVSLVIGVSEDFVKMNSSQLHTGGSGYHSVAVSEDGAELGTADLSYNEWPGRVNYSSQVTIWGSFMKIPAPGYHYYVAAERSEANTSTTVLDYGAARKALAGEVQG